MQASPVAKRRLLHRSVALRITRRTLKREFLGFEAYVWLAQRVTGIVLFVFLLFHLYTLSAILAGEAAYDQTMRSLNHPIIKAGELLLLWVILFHALNGLRLILLAFFPLLQHKALAYAVSLASIIITILSLPVFF